MKIGRAIFVQEICTEVLNNQPSLEGLEKEGASLAQGFKSRETAAVKSRLAALRRQWESLCGRARDASSNLSSHVSHWQQYQSFLQLLFPWLDSAERQLAQEVGRCASEKDASAEYDAHQVSAWLTNKPCVGGCRKKRGVFVIKMLHLAGFVGRAGRAAGGIPAAAGGGGAHRGPARGARSADDAAGALGLRVYRVRRDQPRAGEGATSGIV